MTQRLENINSIENNKNKILQSSMKSTKSTKSTKITKSMKSNPSQLPITTEDENIDYNKVLNSRCGCGSGLSWTKGEVVMAYPCEHMFHHKCFNLLKNNTCTICSHHIEKKLTLFDESLHHQRFADILSMTYYDDMSHTSPGRFIDSMFDLASVIARIPMTTDKTDAKKICEHIFSLNNLTLKVYGMDKLKLEKNKVFVCNHVSHMELIVIYYLLGTGFLASSVTGQSMLVKQIEDIVPVLMFERGDTNRKINLIDEMKKFVDEKGSICLFPEGLMKHPDVLIRFRSGAFHIGRPVYAITIRHNDIICDGYINGFVYKLGGKRDINMEVHILGPYYPPFSEAAIEQVRSDMARHGNMVLSRVANRDVVDIKGKGEI